MRQAVTKAKKARRFNNWLAYQNSFFSTSVFWRRVQGFFGADCHQFDSKHPGLSDAVDGMKARMAQAGNHRKV